MEDKLPNIKPKVKQVFIKVHFLKIGEIDTVKEKYTADIFIQARWREKQLDHKNDYVLDLDSFWDPKLIVQNLIEQTKDDKPWKEVQYTDKKKAYIVEKRRLQGAFSEKLELPDFPFDHQFLNVYITSEYPQSQLEIAEDKEEISLLNSACFVDEQEWQLCDFVTMRKKPTRKDFSQRKRVTFPGLSAGCCAIRRWKFFVWNMVLVMGFISSTSIATFAVDNNLTQNRLQLSITLMLTTVAFRIVTNQGLPKISYNTILDVYLLFSMLFTYTVCIWHAVISLFSSQSYQDDLDLYVFIVMVTVFGLFQIGLFRNRIIKESLQQYEEHAMKVFGESWKHQRNNKKNALRKRKQRGRATRPAEDELDDEDDDEFINTFLISQKERRV
ncbi:unnamed protein product [Mytilus edulis]|uniref:Uncharacterized protein n=1 Tax=Mytilus edulis TaxID=6550 RepID=A0A8S3TXF5_MYTED|nr:unnamed protein product [Mytilus edulis]